MPSAEKRRRKKENTARAREERESAEKRERRRKTAIRVGVIAALAVGGVALLSVLGGEDGDDVAASDTTTASTETTSGSTTTTEPFVPTECTDDTPDDPGEKPTFEAPEQVIDTSKSYTARIETSCGTIVAELDVANAPDGVNNFVFLANAGFYDGLTWHRVVPDFVIQGGDPKGDGTGGPGYDVPTETPGNDFRRGDLAWAKAGTAPSGTAGSQFFVVTGKTGPDNPLNQQVDGEYQYGRFGRVTEGLDVARTIESFNQGDGPPTRPLYIFSVVITES
jgi:cyclophilin family peptidyl-prolyl cis-trans isomerase